MAIGIVLAMTMGARRPSPEIDPMFKAVCYRCSYENPDKTSSHCPVCQFPVILESETTPAGGAQVDTILRSNAPLLPGLDPRPRKAQLLAEARRERLEERRRQSRAHSTQPVVRRMQTQPVAMVVEGVQRAKVAIVCASAVFAGVLAAVINHSLL